MPAPFCPDCKEYHWSTATCQAKAQTWIVLDQSMKWVPTDFTSREAATEKAAASAKLQPGTAYYVAQVVSKTTATFQTSTEAV